MTELIAALVAAHAAGKPIAATVEDTYARIAAHADPALFIALRPEAEALADAQRLAAEGPAGKPLYGVPFAVKDNIDVAGLPTTAACPAFAYRPERSAFVVEALTRAGAIVVGKTNLDQFATGLVGVRSPYGVPRNALRADLIPGGSSSGSATAVGAGLVPFALGTDTAGSGRVPAALNGIVGLKPSLGTLSATGVVPACRTLDTISIFALDVADAFAVFQAACGYDEKDGYSRRFPRPELSGLQPGLRVGAPRADQLSFFGDAEAEAAFARDVESVEDLGVRLVEFDFEPFAEVARLLYEGPWVAERYAATKPLIETIPGALHPVTRAIIEGAKKFDAAAAFEAFYRLADLRRAAERVLSEFDVMLVPTLPRPYTIAEVEAEPVLLNSRLGTYTNFVNLLDLCAIAVPSGMRGDGLPSSVTLIAPAGADGVVAGFAAAIHAASGAPRARPDAPPKTRRRRRRRRRPAASGSPWSARISQGCRSIPSSSRSARPSSARSRRRRTIASTRSPSRSRRSPASSASRTARARRSRRKSGRWIRKLRRLCRQEFPPPLGHWDPSGSRTGRTSRAFWSSPRGSSVRRTFPHLAAGGPISPRSSPETERPDGGRVRWIAAPQRLQRTITLRKSLESSICCSKNAVKTVSSL